MYILSIVFAVSMKLLSWHRNSMITGVVLGVFIPVLTIAFTMTTVFYWRSRLGFLDEYRLDIPIHRNSDTEMDSAEFEKVKSLIQVSEKYDTEDKEELPKTLTLDVFHRIFPTQQYSKVESLGPGADSRTTCAICQEDFNKLNNVCLLGCNHVFHTYCIDQWICRNSACCPLCKRSYSLPRVFHPQVRYIDDKIGASYNSSSRAEQADMWLDLFPDLGEVMDQILKRNISTLRKLAMCVSFTNQRSIAEITIIREGHRRYELLKRVDDVCLESLRDELRRPSIERRP